VAAVEDLVTGERRGIEGGVRLYIDPARDPALLFRCLA
jgi:starch synthase (maltosyl-transferring)